MTSTDLVDRLRQEKGRLAVAVVDEMFTNPFWIERFARRARKHSEEDLAFHVDYVVQALIARDAGVVERYARWLQSVLVSRGMCTIHLSDSFARLSRVIRETIPGGQACTSYLDAAVAALRYEDGFARELQDASARLVAVAVQRFHAARPDDVAAWGERGRKLCEEDAAYHLAYLADALALDRGDLFVAYVGWAFAFHERRNARGERVASMLGILSAAVAEDAALSGGLRAAAGALLERGTASLVRA